MSDTEKDRIDKARHAACTNAYHLKYINQLEARTEQAEKQLAQLRSYCDEIVDSRNELLAELAAKDARSAQLESDVRQLEAEVMKCYARIKELEDDHKL